MNDGKVRATVAAFRQHVPKPQPSDIAELIAVLKAYVEAQPPSRRRAAPGWRRPGSSARRGRAGGPRRGRAR